MYDYCTKNNGCYEVKAENIAVSPLILDVMFRWDVQNWCYQNNIDACCVHVIITHYVGYLVYTTDWGYINIGYEYDSHSANNFNVSQ